MGQDGRFLFSLELFCAWGRQAALHEGHPLLEVFTTVGLEHEYLPPELDALFWKGVRRHSPGELRIDTEQGGATEVKERNRSASIGLARHSSGD